MLSEKMQAALNEQINRELYSSYLYLAMAACADAANLKGTAHWLEVQANEEYGHAMRIYGFIKERGGRVTLKAIAEPPFEWPGLLAMFEAVLEHEKYVTSCIHDLVKMAAQEDDPASAIFLQWFVTEQVEEESSAQDIVAMLKMVGDSGMATVMADRQLGQRQ